MLINRCNRSNDAPYSISISIKVTDVRRSATLSALSNSKCDQSETFLLFKISFSTRSYFFHTIANLSFSVFHDD
jgi:hypothetical protein